MASQQGNPPQGAPGRTLVSLLISQPAVNADGTLTTWFGQYLQRQTQFIGPVQSSTLAGGASLSEQIVTVAEAVDSLQATTGGATTIPASAQAAITALQSAITQLPPPTPQPAPAQQAHQAIPPLAALQPWLTSASISNGGTVTGIYAPLVNGDLPGPNLIADAYGQCVMVQIA